MGSTDEREVITHPSMYVGALTLSLSSAAGERSGYVYYVNYKEDIAHPIWFYMQRCST